MSHLNFLATVIFAFIIIGSVGWLLQEVPSLLKKKYFSRAVKNNKKIVVGMYYKN